MSDYKNEEHKRLDEKIEKLDDEVQDLKLETLTRLASIDTHLEVYNQQLDVHIKASGANSKRLEHVEDHVIKVDAIMKFCGWFLGIAIAVGSLIVGYMALK